MYIDKLIKMAEKINIPATDETEKPIIKNVENPMVKGKEVVGNNINKEQSINIPKNSNPKNAEELVAQLKQTLDSLPEDEQLLVLKELAAEKKQVEDKNQGLKNNDENKEQALSVDPKRTEGAPKPEEKKDVDATAKVEGKAAEKKTETKDTKDAEKKSEEPAEKELSVEEQQKKMQEFIEAQQKKQKELQDNLMKIPEYATLYSELSKLDRQFSNHIVGRDLDEYDVQRPDIQDRVKRFKQMFGNLQKSEQTKTRQKELLAQRNQEEFLHDLKTFNVKNLLGRIVKPFWRIITLNASTEFNTKDPNDKGHMKTAINFLNRDIFEKKRDIYSFLSQKYVYPEEAKKFYDNIGAKINLPGVGMRRFGRISKNFKKQEKISTRLTQLREKYLSEIASANI
jgi:hypothetical protein